MRPPLPFFRFSSLLGAGFLTFLLGACGTTPTSPASTPTVSQPDAVNGGTAGKAIIIAPPDAGKATFGSGRGAQYVPLATAEVQSMDEFDLTLPTSIRSGAGELLTLVPAELFQLQSCVGKPQQSDPSAELRVLNQGEYRINGTVVGKLTPMVQALAATISSQSTAVMMMSNYVHADRPTTVSGRLSCLLDGTERPVDIQVNYQFKQGWNMIEARVEENTETGSIGATAKTLSKLGTLAWRFLPLNP